MDETLKVIIGTLSGFIIAFFAEPVKSWIQNRSKQRSFRYALYQELYSNCIALGSIQEPDTLQLVLRKEFYLSCLTQDAMIYYQLKEATALNVIYTYYLILLEAKESEGTVESALLNRVIKFFESGILDIKVMNQIDKSFLSIVKSNLKEIKQK